MDMYRQDFILNLGKVNSRIAWFTTAPSRIGERKLSLSRER
jgi:hypothetical protein